MVTCYGQAGTGKTLLAVMRMASGSKLVLVGDPEQIDNTYVDRLSNGLVFTRDRLRNEACSAHVTLEKGNAASWRKPAHA